MDVDSIIKQADEALEAGDDRLALEAGRQLVELRYTYGFEVIARAHWHRGEKTRAVAALQEGLEKAPRVWRLWELLAEYWGEMGDDRRARESYEAILAIDDADPVAHVSALVGLGRNDEAAALATNALADAPEEPRERARLHMALSHARFAADDSEAALKSAWDAVALDPSNEDAMWMIREVEQRLSDKAHQYRVIVQGEWPAGIESAAGPASFYANYVVVADDEREAKAFVTRFEREEVRPTLIFEETEDLGDAAGLPKGIYWRSGSVFWDGNESKA